MIKQCCRCKRGMPTTDFCKSRQTKDGLDPRCKACRSELAKLANARPEVKAQKAAAAVAWRLKNPDKYKANYRRFNAMPKYAECRKVESARWEQTDEGKAWRKEWRAKNRQILRGHWAVKNALQTGQLTRPPACQQCGIGGKPQAHHHKGYDAEHRLDVVWLCPKCHAAANG